MREKNLILTLVLLLTLFSTSTALAVPTDPPMSTSETIKDEGGFFEKIIAAPVNALVSVFQTLEEKGGFHTFDVLVFNEDLSSEDKEMAPFSKDDWDKANTWYAGMATICGGIALIAVMITAYRFMIAGAIKPKSRQDAMEDMWRWLGTVLLIAAAPFLFYIVFSLNNALVDSLKSVAVNVGAETGDLSNLSLSGVDGDSSLIANITTGSVLGTALVKLMFCGIEAWLNIIYIMRRFILMGIYIFTPLMAWMWAINKNVNALPIWVGELLSNAFMQSAHALCLLIFLTFCDVNTTGTSWLVLLVWLGTIIPLSEMFRNSVQSLFTRMSGVDEAGTASKILGGIGLGAVSSAGRLMGTMKPVNTPNVGSFSGSGGAGGSPGTDGGSGFSQGSFVDGAQMAMAAGGGGGMSMAGSMATGAMTPGDAGIVGGMPSGYTTTQSGLTVPSNVTGVGVVEQQKQAQLSTSAMPGQGLGLVRAANTARTAANVAGTLTAATVGTMFSMVPGGERIATGAAKVSAGITSGVATGASIAKQTYDRYQTNKDTAIDGGGGMWAHKNESRPYGVADAFKEVTGSSSVSGGVAKSTGVATAEGLGPMVGNETLGNNMIHHITNAPVPTTDSPRWR